MGNPIKNHNSDITLAEYRKRLSKTHKNEWVKISSDPEGTITIPMSNLDCNRLLSAALTSRRSELVEDEINDFELVEFNSFGADFAPGSALFHWLNDKDILYGNGDTITVRFITA